MESQGTCDELTLQNAIRFNTI